MAARRVTRTCEGPLEAALAGAAPLRLRAGHTRETTTVIIVMAAM